MVLVAPGNDALATAVEKARKQIGHPVETRYVVGVSTDEGKLVLGFASVRGGKATLFEHQEIDSAADIPKHLYAFARKVEIEHIDLVFKDERGEGGYLRKWVLVDSKTLKPRLVKGSRIEAAYNPV